MILPYEIIYRSVVPTIRYMVAKRLIEDHNLTQKEVATRLGVTQPAVSNYIRRTRATLLNLESNKQVTDRINHLTASFLIGDYKRPEIIENITELCDYMRKNKLLCKFHKQIEPSYQTEECNACHKINTIYF